MNCRNSYRCRKLRRPCRCVAVGLGVVVALGVAIRATAQEPSWEATPTIVISTTPYNFHLVVSEEFLNRFVARNEVEPGPVDDFVFGAKVDGQQTTASQLRLDLRPSAEQGTAALVLTGQVHALTVGRTDQGAVQSASRQDFIATKDVYFDGTALSTRRAAVQVRASNQPLAAWTRLDGTLLEGLGQKLAITRAEQQRPESEAYARNKVAAKVYSSFNEGVDNELANANGRLMNDLLPLLKTYKLEPDARRTQTTDTHLHQAFRWAGMDPNTQFPTPTTRLAGARAVSVYLHESLFNGLVDRLQLAGRKTKTSELKALLEDARRNLGISNSTTTAPARPSAIPGLTGSIDTDIEFDAVDPLRIRLQGDELRIELRATFKPAGQPLLPPLFIVIPWRMVQQGATWQVTPGRVTIQSTGTQPLPDVAEQLIRQTIEAQLPDSEFPRELTIPGWPANRPPLQLAEVRSADGWIAVSLD